MSINGKNGHNGDGWDNKKVEGGIIHFPSQEERNKRRSQKDKDKKDEKLKKKQEEEWRKQYRLRRAAEYGGVKIKNGKIPLVNWERVPMFPRYMVGLLVAVQLVFTFLPDQEKVFVLYNFGFIPAQYTGHVPFTAFALLSPLTSLFLHGGFMHLFFNSLMLLIMCIFTQQYFGWKESLKIFLISGLAGCLGYFILSPFSSVPVIGASGATSGLFAVTFMVMYRMRAGMLLPSMNKGPWPFIILWSVIIVVFGLMSSDVAWQSHLGGFFGGLAYYHFGMRRKGFGR